MSSIRFKHDDNGMLAVIDCDFIANTTGDGYWSDAVRPVHVKQISMYLFNVDHGYNEDVGIYYDENTWNNKNLGLIYTDKGFLEEVRKQLVQVLGPSGADIDYSEQGMQENGRVSCDAGKKFIRALWHAVVVQCLH